MANLILPLLNTDSIAWTFQATTPLQAQADVNVTESITIGASGLMFINDATSPGVSQYYGTTSSGIKGWQSLSGITGISEITVSGTANEISVSGSPVSTPGGTVTISIPTNPILLGETTLSRLNLVTDVLSPSTEVTMSGDRTLTAGADTTYQWLDPNGSNRNLTLPASATGLTYFVANLGTANTITVKDNSAVLLTTIAASSNKTFIYSGSAWRNF